MHILCVCATLESQLIILCYVPAPSLWHDKLISTTIDICHTSFIHGVVKPEVRLVS